MYVFISTSMYLCMYVCKYARVYAYFHVYMCMYVCIHAFMNVSICLRTNGSICVSTYVCFFSRIIIQAYGLFVCAQIRKLSAMLSHPASLDTQVIYTYKYIYIYICMYIYIHLCEFIYTCVSTHIYPICMYRYIYI